MMNEHLFYDLKDKPSLTRSLATQIVHELGRRIVAGADGQGDLLLAAAMDAVSRQSAKFSRGGGGT